MSVITITPPGPVLTVDEAKVHLRVDGADENAYIAGLILAAQGTIDGPMGWLGLAIGLQTLELRAPAFEACGGLFLPYGPVDVTSVSYVGVSGAAATLPAEAYVLEDDRLLPAPGTLWPSVQLRANAVRVRYRAGFPPAEGGAPGSTVPAPILHAIKVMIALLYENRIGSAADLQTNPTVAALLGPRRVWGF